MYGQGNARLGYVHVLPSPGLGFALDLSGPARSTGYFARSTTFVYGFVDRRPKLYRDYDVLSELIVRG